MEEPPPILETEPAAPKPPAMSLFARLLNVFAVPGDVFQEVKHSVTCAGNWLAPALLLIAAGWLGAYLIYSQEAIQQRVREMNDQVIQKLVDSGKLPKEQAERQRQASEVGAKISPYFGPVFVAFVTPFAWGFILWLIGNKALKGNFTYMKGVEVAGLANAVAVLESIVTTLLCVSLSSPFASPSPALLVKDFDPQNPSQALLTVVNVMTFWVLAVRAIGVARLSGAPFLKAAIWVFGIWLGYTGLLIGIGLGVKSLLGL
jgi:hypothetical protein